MSDLISRLSEIRSQYNCFNESEEPYYRALSEVIKMLSEQPEITEEDLREWCNKRCLTIIDNALYFEMRSRWAAFAQTEIIRCKDCKYHDEGYRRISVKWLPCMDMRLGSNWYCADAERRTDGPIH